MKDCSQHQLRRIILILTHKQYINYSITQIYKSKQQNGHAEISNTEVKTWLIHRVSKKHPQHFLL